MRRPLPSSACLHSQCSPHTSPLGAQAPPGAPPSDLNALELYLRQPDAILEPGILDVLRRYVADGGKPSSVVELLTEYYTGAYAAGRCRGLAATQHTYVGNRKPFALMRTWRGRLCADGQPGGELDAHAGRGAGYCRGPAAGGV